MKTQEVTILMVDDDELDIDGMKRAFKKAKIGNPIVEASDGMHALEHMRGTNGRPKIKRPYLVLLDLNMPRMNGLEFLDEVRNDEQLKDTIVFVLTTSDRDEDRWQAYDANVAGYVLKSHVGKDFLNLITMLDHFWKIVEFPIGRR